MSVEEDYKFLRHKLDLFGYHQQLPISAIPLVTAIFNDLVKATENLRDSKLQICNLLEEKSSWELSVKPYQCENSRLLAENNRLHLELIRQRESYEERICEYLKKLRTAELDKKLLEEHCIELENQIRSLASGKTTSDSKILKCKKDGINMNRKPFISTVRSGVIIPPDPQTSHLQLPTKCGRCHATINWSKMSVINAQDIEKLQNDVKEQSDLVAFYKKKIEARDREIDRLNQLLSKGGRPIEALAKECCYKDVGTLSEDIESLQKEKTDYFRKINEYQHSMHEAMKKAVDLSEKNQKLQNELDEFKKVALQVEEQANNALEGKEQEIVKLKNTIKKLQKDIQTLEGTIESSDNNSIKSHNKIHENKRKLHERLNELTVKEQELRAENDRINQKYQKLKAKLADIQRDNVGYCPQKQDKSVLTIDEEKIRLKSERDFFQKEYLRILERAVSEKEVNFLRSQIEAKDQELVELRSELSRLKLRSHPYQDILRPSSTSSISPPPNPACVQATLSRIERERDLIKAELDHIKCERDTLHEKLHQQQQQKIDDIRHYEEEIQHQKTKIIQLESKIRELSTSQIPYQTHVTLMKEEIEELKKRSFELQTENKKLSTSYNQLKILHEQTEKTLTDYENRLRVTESQLENAESRLSSLGTSRDATRNEICSLRNEISILKQTNTTLENEKDKIIAELDLKTEKLYRLEYELKELHRKKLELEHTVLDLQEKLNKATCEKRERECELHETSHTSTTLKHQLTALKASRDQAIEENRQISVELANTKSELNHIKRKLNDSEKEVDRLKQQLQQYVQEVKKAEDLLSQKEQEREEMLEHYRSLSHDAVVLEGNNQSLENEAAEIKQQLIEAEIEIKRLKKEITTKDGIIRNFEAQVSSLSIQISQLEKELEQANDERRLLKVELDATKELCDKLEFQSIKLNAELSELQNIRSKLEEENEKLRLESSISNASKTIAPVSNSSAFTNSNRTPIIGDTTAQLNRELEMQRQITNQMTKEMHQLRLKIEELQQKYKEQCEKATKNEVLATELRSKVQELEHNLIDERFNRARSRDLSPSGGILRLVGGEEKKSRSIEISRKKKNHEKFLRILSKVDTKARLVQDIDAFLKKGKLKKDSQSSFQDRFSFSENSEEITVRKNRTITKRIDITREKINDKQNKISRTSATDIRHYADKSRHPAEEITLKSLPTSTKSAPTPLASTSKNLTHQNYSLRTPRLRKECENKTNKNTTQKSPKMTSFRDKLQLTPTNKKEPIPRTLKFGSSCKNEENENKLQKEREKKLKEKKARSIIKEKEGKIKEDTPKDSSRSPKIKMTQRAKRLTPSELRMITHKDILPKQIIIPSTSSSGECGDYIKPLTNYTPRTNIYIPPPHVRSSRSEKHSNIETQGLTNFETSDKNNHRAIQTEKIEQSEKGTQSFEDFDDYLADEPLSLLPFGSSEIMSSTPKNLNELSVKSKTIPKVTFNKLEISPERSQNSGAIHSKLDYMSPFIDQLLEGNQTYQVQKVPTDIPGTDCEEFFDNFSSTDVSFHEPSNYMEQNTNSSIKKLPTPCQTKNKKDRFCSCVQQKRLELRKKYNIPLSDEDVNSKGSSSYRRKSIICRDRNHSKC